jgi:hypothetical protein
MSHVQDEETPKGVQLGSGKASAHLQEVRLEEAV